MPALLERSLELLERLVAFPTVSEQSNLALIEWVADFLGGCGLEAHILASPDGRKANLFATLGPPGGGILLSGHSDVVPVEGQAWNSDPFTLTRRGERLYGRGTCDMKGFIACALALLESRRGQRLATPLHLVLSYDEELGCLGIPHLLGRLGQDLPLPRIAIVGEPTGMTPVNAHKGFRAFRTTIRGQAVHSSLPDLGVSAIRLAGAVLQALEALAAELRASLPPGNAGLEPPHSTLNVGRIAGGNAVNIVAQDCWLEWEFRPAPGDDPAAILARFQALLAAALPPDLAAREGLARIVTEETAAEPVFAPELESPALRLVSRLTGHNRAEAAPYGTEAGFFQQAGLSTILLGPGDIAQAHQPDEYIELAQLRRALDFLTALADWAARQEVETA